MIKVEIGGKDYDCPESWDDITIAKFEEIAKHNSLLAEYKSVTLFSLELFEILLDCPIDEIKKLNRTSFDKLNEILEFTSDKPETKKVTKYNINGDIFLPIDNFNDITMGEQISLELKIKESNNYNLIGNILPILIRKADVVADGDDTKLVAKSFDVDKYDEYRELFRKHLVITDVIGLTNFFLSGDK